MARQLLLLVCFSLLFFVSGATGLVYQSVWSKYLALILGHASYAQIAMISLFMAGLALGALLANGLVARRVNLLYAYAIVELVLAAAAFAFHDLFEQGRDVLPLIPYAGRWLVAAAFLPLCVLLGLTFPLFTVGLRRVLDGSTERITASMYFVNSLGASLGALLSIFWLIPRFELSGALTLAGVANFAIACLVLVAAYVLPGGSETERRRVSDWPLTDSRLVALLVATFLSSAASFIYEIGFIRMLSLVLGSTTHVFEIVLAAFVGGIAIGSLWARSLAKSPRALEYFAYAQLLMGLAVVAAVACYPWTFDWIAAALSALNRSDAGYDLFLILSTVLALVLMLPTAACAGATLPLLVGAAIHRGAGEESIGRLFGANTLGAILGVVLALAVLMPLLGLKTMMLVAAGVDCVIGFAFLRQIHDRLRTLLAYLFPIAGAFFLAIVLVSFDPLRLASGVYRHGLSQIDGKALFYRDGRTASVAVYDVDRHRVLATNGKPDASLALSRSDPATPDEVAQLLTAAIPLSLSRDPKRAAVVGLGSGVTTGLLLADVRVRSVDTIEIEAAIVEGSTLFPGLAERAHSDPRSAIHVDDAKAFFYSSSRRYDLIISEPSNPWVSGVAGLFSVDFYDDIQRYLANEGLFVQWMQLYEIDPPLVLSVLEAVDQAFPHYAIFQMDVGNFLIVAGREPIAAFRHELFANARIRSELARIDVQSKADMAMRFFADQRLLRPALRLAGARPNTDYNMLLSMRAPRARFKAAGASSMFLPSGDGLWVSRELSPAFPVTDWPSSSDRPLMAGIDKARLLAARVEGSADFIWLTPDAEQSFEFLRETVRVCPTASTADFWFSAAEEIIPPILRAAPHARRATIFAGVLPEGCADKGVRSLVRTLLAFASDDWNVALHSGTQFLETAAGEDPFWAGLAGRLAAIAALKDGKAAEAQMLIAELEDEFGPLTGFADQLLKAQLEQQEETKSR